MRLIAAVCLVVSTLLAGPTKAAVPIDVTMIQLIANPEKFDGKLIRVIGFLKLEFEGNVLYLHREDYEYALSDGIWVDVTLEIKKHSNELNMHYVLLEGVFNSRDRGHMDMWSGTITKIQRAERWIVPERGKS